MRNKLLALILVLVIVVLTLASCGEYSYLDDKMTNYTTVKTSELKNALSTLKITDGDFTADKRTDIVNDETYTNLAKAVKDYVGAANGKIGEHDTVKYCAYYTVADKDGAIHTVIVSMDPEKATSMQLGLSTNAGLTAAIDEKLKGVDDFTGFKKVAPAEEDLGADQFVLVTYTEVTGEGESKTETTYTDAPVVIAEGEGISGFLFGKKLNAIEDTDAYKGVKVNGILSGTAFTVEHDVTGSDIKDIAGKTVELGEDKKASYNIYPVSVIATPEKNAKNILVYAIGTALSTSSLDCLGKDDVKDLVTALIENNNKLISAYLDAAKAYDKEASEGNEKALEDAGKALDEKLNPVLDKAKDDIVKQYLYSAKQSAYNTAVKSAVIDAVYEVISSKDYFTDNGKLPEKAVDAQYDQLISNYKKALYGSEGSATYSKYASKLNPFESYLMDETKTSSYDDAKKAVRKDAEAYVTTIVHIYAVAEALGCEYTSAEFEDYKKAAPEEGYSSNEYLNYTQNGYADADIMTAKQFDKIMNKIISSSINEDGDIEFKSDFIPALSDMIKK